jgi:Zn-dependent peptidase ImmA (M78 family)
MKIDLLRQHTPPEWNVRVLTEDDFWQQCDQAGILVQEIPLEQPGLFIFRNDQPQIFINDELRGAERTFVCFHELAHYWLHPSRIQFFQGLEETVEVEADVVAICAMIPFTVLMHYWPGEIVELYGYPPSMVTLRREVFDRWRI